jgi:hypothetical protein
MWTFSTHCAQDGLQRNAHGWVLAVSYIAAMHVVFVVAYPMHRDGAGLG